MEDFKGFANFEAESACLCWHAMSLPLWHSPFAFHTGRGSMILWGSGFENCACLLFPATHIWDSKHFLHCLTESKVYPEFLSINSSTPSLYCVFTLQSLCVYIYTNVSENKGLQTAVILWHVLRADRYRIQSVRHWAVTLLWLATLTFIQQMGEVSGSCASHLSASKPKLTL